ncbi:MAG: MBL fold metallo-hydrolase [Isosphaeraceae bacterium]
MPHSICVTCGVQYPETPKPPENCPVCDDDRQYVGLQGQQWTTLDDLRGEHENTFKHEASGLTSIQTTPKFAIGQRAFLIQSPGGNVLWDCVSLIDDATVKTIQERGGLAAVAISHPHFYATMVEWSRAFGGIPIYVHADDNTWIMRPDPAVTLWEGEIHTLHDGLTLVRCGGHFEGSTVLHWPAGADGRGALLVGDTLQVVPDLRHVSFMRSYPNYIPLPTEAVRRIARAVAPFSFEQVLGMFPGLTIPSDGQGAVARSIERYLNAIKS